MFFPPNIHNWRWPCCEHARACKISPTNICCRLGLCSLLPFLKHNHHDNPRSENNVPLNAIDLEKVKEGKRACGQQTLKRCVDGRKKNLEGNLHACTHNYNVSLLKGSYRWDQLSYGNLLKLHFSSLQCMSNHLPHLWLAHENCNLTDARSQ